MEKITKLLSSAALVAGVAPFIATGVASATPGDSINACSINPTTISLAEGESASITIGWGDASGATGAISDIAFADLSLNGTVVQGTPVPMGTVGTNPFTVPFSYDMFKSILVSTGGGKAGTVKYAFFATDGTAKVGSELCSLTINMAAPASTTTTTVPTLPRTGGSSAPYAFAGFLMAAAGVALRRTRRQS